MSGAADAPAPLVRRRTGPELTTTQLYALLALRVDIFVVEQACPYPELDGQDLLASTTHLWVPDGDQVLAGIRVLRTGTTRPVIGRVVTAADARGAGLAATLLTAGVELCGPAATVELHAQEHLEHWYGRFGFVRTGETYDGDGIPHVPMLRTPTA